MASSIAEEDDSLFVGDLDVKKFVIDFIQEQRKRREIVVRTSKFIDSCKQFIHRRVGQMYIVSGIEQALEQALAELNEPNKPDEDGPIEHYISCYDSRGDNTQDEDDGYVCLCPYFTTSCYDIFSKKDELDKLRNKSSSLDTRQTIPAEMIEVGDSIDKFPFIKLKIVPSLRFDLIKLGCIYPLIGGFDDGEELSPDRSFSEDSATPINTNVDLSEVLARAQTSPQQTSLAHPRPRHFSQPNIRAMSASPPMYSPDASEVERSQSAPLERRSPFASSKSTSSNSMCEKFKDLMKPVPGFQLFFCPALLEDRPPALQPDIAPAGFLRLERRLHFSPPLKGTEIIALILQAAPFSDQSCRPWKDSCVVEVDGVIAWAICAAPNSVDGFAAEESCGYVRVVLLGEKSRPRRLVGMMDNIANRIRTRLDFARVADTIKMEYLCPICIFLGRSDPHIGIVKGIDDLGQDNITSPFLCCSSTKQCMVRRELVLDSGHGFDEEALLRHLRQVVLEAAGSPRDLELGISRLGPLYQGGRDDKLLSTSDGGSESKSSEANPVVGNEASVFGGLGKAAYGGEGVGRDEAGYVTAIEDRGGRDGDGATISSPRPDGRQIPVEELVSAETEPKEASSVRSMAEATVVKVARVEVASIRIDAGSALGCTGGTVYESKGANTQTQTLRFCRCGCFRWACECKKSKCSNACWDDELGRCRPCSSFSRSSAPARNESGHTHEEVTLEFRFVSSKGQKLDKQSGALVRMSPPRPVSSIGAVRAKGGDSAAADNLILAAAGPSLDEEAGECAASSEAIHVLTSIRKSDGLDAATNAYFLVGVGVGDTWNYLAEVCDRFSDVVSRPTSYGSKAIEKSEIVLLREIASVELIEPHKLLIRQTRASGTEGGGGGGGGGGAADPPARSNPSWSPWQCLRVAAPPLRHFAFALRRASQTRPLQLEDVVSTCGYDADAKSAEFTDSQQTIADYGRVVSLHGCSDDCICGYKEIDHLISVSPGRTSDWAQSSGCCHCNHVLVRSYSDKTLAGGPVVNLQGELVGLVSWETHKDMSGVHVVNTVAVQKLLKKLSASSSSTCNY